MLIQCPKVDAVDVTADPSNSLYVYDAENRIICVGGTVQGASCVISAPTVYYYNANGERIRKMTGGTSVDYLYELGGHVITEVSSSGGMNRGEIFAGSRHLATYNNGTTYFIHSDWLGTERVRANLTGTSIESCTNQPFGDNQICTGTDMSPLHFTGKQRDAETNLDYFGARYYSSTMARFATPDWSATTMPVAFAKLDTPQSLNLYPYVGNNPLIRIDADGHSYLVYDGSAHTLTLYSSKGDEVGHWEAHNNVAVHNRQGDLTKGPVQDGTYDVRKNDASGTDWGHAGEKNYGSEGIVHFEGMQGATGETMIGAGVHSGHDDDTGWNTFGCVRTTDTAMGQIKSTANTDPLTTLEVKNNQDNLAAWNKKKEAAKKPAESSKGPDDPHTPPEKPH